jgi:hypothetical protein
MESPRFNGYLQEKDHEANHASRRPEGNDMAIKVTVVDAAGLRKGERAMQEISAFCVCGIRGKDACGFTTLAARKTNTPEWAHDEVLPDYENGDILTFAVFDKDWHGNTELLGTVELESSQFLPHGFDGDLDLTDMKGGNASTLRIKVAAVSKGIEIAVLPMCLKQKRIVRGPQKSRARDLFGTDSESVFQGGSSSCESLGRDEGKSDGTDLILTARCASTVLRPDASTRMCWDVCGIFILLIDLFWIPMQVFDPTASAGVVAIGWVTLIYWTQDILLTFNTGFYSDYSLLNLQRGAIAKRYLRSWFLFDFMLVAVDWLEIIQKATGTSSVAGGGMGAARAGRVARVMRVVRLLRLMRLAKLRRLLFEIQNLIDSEWLSVTFAVGKNLAMIVVMNHYSACGWFLVGKSAGPDGWVARLEYDHKDYGVQYLESLGWSMCQFTPGSARASAVSIGEQVYSLVVLGLSLVVSTCFVGSISATMGSVWASNRYSSTQGFLLKKFLSQKGISRDLGARVTRYVDCVVEFRHKIVPIGKVEYLKLLSGPLNVQLRTMIFQPHLLGHPFFLRCSHSSKTAMRHICSSSLQTECYAKNDSVFGRGTMAKSMYFITRGFLVYRFHQSNSNKRTVKLEEHHWFLENALFIPWKHHGHMKGLSDCESTVLNANKFWDVTAKSHSGTFHLAQREAIVFASRIRSCLCFGPGHVTDVPREQMALLLSGGQQETDHGSMSDIHKAEQLEIDLIDFSDSDSDVDDEDLHDPAAFARDFV